MPLTRVSLQFDERENVCIMNENTHLVRDCWQFSEVIGYATDTLPRACIFSEWSARDRPARGLKSEWGMVRCDAMVGARLRARGLEYAGRCNYHMMLRHTQRLRGPLLYLSTCVLYLLPHTSPPLIAHFVAAFQPSGADALALCFSNIFTIWLHKSIKIPQIT